MSDEITQPRDDTFVIAGMAFREEGGEPVQWSSGHVPAVAPISVAIATGVTVTVDVARPADVLKVRIADFGDPAELVAACEAGAETAVAQMAQDNAIADIELTLRPNWARRALVAGVSRWMPRPIHEGALLLDEAAAHHAVEELIAAARMAALGQPVLEALTADCEDGFLSAATSTVLTDVSRSVADAVADQDWGGSIGQCAERIAAAVGLSDIDFQAALEEFNRLEVATSGALTAGAVAAGPSAASGPVSVISQLIDPTVTTARVIKWVSADHKELHVTEYSDGDEVVAEFELEMSDYVDERSYEVSTVTVFAADRATGQLLRTGRARVENRTLRTSLRYPAPGGGVHIVYGVFNGDNGVGALRTREDDDLSIVIDRLLLEAWSTHRAALVLQMRIGELTTDPPADATSKRDTLLDDARSGVIEAQIKLGTALRVATDGIAELEARLAAVTAYLDLLTEHGNIPQPGCAPLLAELLPLIPEPGAAIDH